VNRSLLLRTVLLRLNRYRLKTLFMGLGIMVSVAATVLLQTAAGSVREAFSSFIERAYPADSVVLMAGTGFMGGGEGSRNLRLADAETIANSIGVTDWDPVVYAGSRDVTRAGRSAPVSVVGYSEKAESVRRRSAQSGEFFSPDDVKRRANVALIGATTAEKLFADESPIGAQLFIDNVPFEVKGVLEKVGVDPHGNDQDDTIFVPYTTLMERMLRRDFISGATFVIEDRSRADAVAKDMAGILRERHQIGQGQEDDFSVITPVLMNDMLDRAFKAFNLFIPLIGGTAFLISAIVILSIMQISIKGRVSEIGLRKALGARSRDLQIQIVLEVLVVSAVASLIGLLLAQLGSTVLTPILAAKFGVTRMSPPAMVLLVAVGAAMVTGLLGGVWPARRAAKLNPVEALK
jgi:putative ABC transport system permease protein